MKRIIRSGWAVWLAGCLCVPAFAAMPSFNCERAQTAVEQAICHSDALATQDRELARQYDALLGTLDPSAAYALEVEEKQWLGQRDATCGAWEDARERESCLLRYYRNRNAALAARLDPGSQSQGADTLVVLRVTPAGNDVPAAQQMVFQFDRPVVPVGRMDRETADIPVSIEPALHCEWRWLNTSALACQLRPEDKMKEATRYDVVMQPGLAAVSGETLAESIRHTFITARPKVTYARFVNWLSPGTPMIQLTFNQPVTRASVESAITMTARRAKENQPVPVVAYPDTLPRQQPWWMLLAPGNDEGQPVVDDRLANVGEDEARRIWVIEPRQELPLGETIWLDVAPGLKSSEGPEAGVERRTVVSFETYPAFRFVGIRCAALDNQRLRDISLETLQSGDDPAQYCEPLSPVALLFSAPVVNSMVKEHVAFAPRLDGNRKDYDPWANRPDRTSLQYPHRAGRLYPVWLPELLQANQQYSVSIDATAVKDEFGRALPAVDAFDFHTSHRQAKLLLNYQQAVLEKDVDNDVPMYITNLDNVSVAYSRLGDQDSQSGLGAVIPVAKPEDIAYAAPLGIRKLLDKNDTGIVYAEVHPDPVPPNWYRDPAVLAQVTPYEVHFKAGHFNSLAWVTRFADGKPVNQARVTLLRGSYPGIGALADLGIQASTNQDGLAVLPGLAEIDSDLQWINRGQMANNPGLFVKVEADGDIAVLPLSYDFLIRSNGLYPSLRVRGGHTRAWGTTAQGIYKLGDTVQFKVYVRDQSNKTWVAPEKRLYDLQVEDPQRRIVYEKKNLALNEFGAFDDEFKVPEGGAVGWYRFSLMPVKEDGQKQYRFVWSPMSVLISDFTPAPFKVTTDLNGDSFTAQDRVDISSMATLHAGGPFSDAEIRLTAKLLPRSFTSKNPVAAGFVFGGSYGYLRPEQMNLLNVRSHLNDAGKYEDTFTLPDADIYAGSLIVESAVKDGRGKFVASSSQADYVGRDRFVGLRNTQWVYQAGKKARLETLVLDPQGNPVAGEDVSVKISYRDYKASRVKGPGNAYLTQNIMTWVDEATCKVRSQRLPVYCEFVPQRAGAYQFVASVKDQKGREHSSTLYGWVSGSGAVVWDQTNDATLAMVGEKANYEVGDTAHFLVKNPYPGAQALVTVERYGVLDSWVQTLEGSAPVIELPIKPDYLPGFYLSVVVVSPRVEQPLGPDKVDLGKPGYRMGYVTVGVSDPAKKLPLAVSTGKDTYKPGDKVKARIKIAPAQFRKDDKYEMAVAVVDESVLAMNQQGDQYYDPYAGFNKLDGLDVNNYSLISRLVGRQKFEKKGANPGGDGSAYSKLRNTFRFVAYWNPSVVPDDKGEASVEFTVPDNLTGWRILAFVVDRNDRMGLGQSNIKVNQPTEIRPVMPNQVTEGDAFQAGFEVLNRTDKPRALAVKVDVNGPLAAGQDRHFEQVVKIAPFKRAEIFLPVRTLGYGSLSFVVSAGDARDSDRLQHDVPVHARRSLETGASYGTTTEDEASDPVRVPEGIYTDVGYVGVVLSPSVIGNLDGAFRYLKDYPYWCWEQRLSRAVAASAYVRLRDYLGASVEWDSPSAEVERTLASAANFQAASGGMAYWQASNAQVSPYLSAYTALAFNWLRKAGYTIPAQVELRLHQYLLALLRTDEFPTFYTEGMSSSVRAVALAALAEAGKINSDDVARYERHVPEMDLFGKAHFLQAALRVAGVGAGTMNTVMDDILAHASQSGGKFQFSEPWDDSYKYILATPLRSNCAILDSLLEARRLRPENAAIEDIPFKLVRSVTQTRGNRDHWENTQENVFCLNALVDYASAYESVDPDMKVAVRFRDEGLGTASFVKRTAAPITIQRAIRASDPGVLANMQISRSGEGRLYYSTRVAYAMTAGNASLINAGIDVRREYSVERDGEFVLLHSPMELHRGDIVKIDLFVSVPTARHFVVVDDPVPGGLEPVNEDLATTSRVDADKGRMQAAKGSWFFTFSDWSYYGRYFYSFYHKELRHDSARFYADYLPAGNYRLSYTAQAIAEGEFSVMPVSAEEMYDPDVYGKGLPAVLKVH